MTLEDLYETAEAYHIQVDAFDLHTCESLSLMDADGSCYVAIDPFKLTSNADEKTKLGHELGHCETGSFYNQYSPFDLRQRHENRADKWAIKKLVPKDELNAARGKGYTEVWELAEYFGVTEDFMRKAICWYTNGNLAVDAYL